jgi:thiamine biosynthesis lipoprotein
MKGLLLPLFALLIVGNAQGQKAVSKDTILMGSAFSFTAVHESPQGAWDAIVVGIQEVQRIEALISSWSSTSETSAINRNAGIQPVKVSKELFDLIQRSKSISELSNGHFDISFASIDKVWKFDGSMKSVPTDAALATSVAEIDYHKIVLDDKAKTVFLSETGMRIGFGAIGKGYAAEQAKKVMESVGSNSGVVNAGGDLAAWGTRPDGKDWSIGIADPTDKNNVLSYLNISNYAVVTSGNYERFAEIDGKRYCHIINPKTGWPVTGMQSVTIICETAEVADALATTVFVLGEKDGLALINHLQGVECIIVNNRQEFVYSENVELNFIREN